MWNVVQTKTPYQHFSTQSCILCSFHSYFTYSTLHWRRPNKTTLLLITLQKIAVRTLKYKYKVWNVTVLFKLLVAKFVHSFDNGELLNTDNYFSDIASVHTYQTRAQFFLKILFTQNESVSWSAFFKYIGPKIWSDTAENLKSHLIHLENITKISSYLLNIPVEFRHFGVRVGLSPFSLCRVVFP